MLTLKEFRRKTQEKRGFPKLSMREEDGLKNTTSILGVIQSWDGTSRLPNGYWKFMETKFNINSGMSRDTILRVLNQNASRMVKTKNIKESFNAKDRFIEQLSKTWNYDLLNEKMTRDDFIAAAEIIKEIPNLEIRSQVGSKFMELFQKANSEFKPDKFMLVGKFKKVNVTVTEDVPTNSQSSGNIAGFTTPIIRGVLRKNRVHLIPEGMKTPVEALNDLFDALKQSKDKSAPGIISQLRAIAKNIKELA